MSKLKKFIGGLTASLSAMTLVAVPVMAASTVTVSPSNTNGWVFNTTVPFVTAYEFNEDAASMGEGSLFVEPIINTLPQNKFIAAKTVGALTSDVEYVSFDFQLADGVNSTLANQFYLNVYTNLPGQNVFYNCRFDYAAVSGSDSAFTTVLASSTAAATAVADRSGDLYEDNLFTCPTNWESMPAGSTASFVTVNVGDTSTSDTGAGGYLDNVVVTVATDNVTYDFEDDPTILNNKDQCKNGGWMTSDIPSFKNQGACVSFMSVSGNPKALANNPRF